MQLLVFNFNSYEHKKVHLDEVNSPRREGRWLRGVYTEPLIPWGKLRECARHDRARHDEGALWRVQGRLPPSNRPRRGLALGAISCMGAGRGFAAPDKTAGHGGRSHLPTFACVLASVG